MEAKRRKVDSDGDAASEADVGIREYVSPELTGFTGLIKQRYSDFQVNEIGLDGKVVVLKEAPKQVKEEEKKEEKKDDEKEEKKDGQNKDQKDGAESKENAEPQVEPSEKTEKLAAIVGEDLVKQLLDLANSSDFNAKIKVEGAFTKEQRTEIHTLVREGFASKLDSRTEDGSITILRPKKRQNRIPRSQLPNGGGVGPRGMDFLHFTLYKENKDTMEAVSLVAKLLHIPTKAISFCGTKDRRAATTQRCCWRRGNTNRLLGLNLRGNMVVSDFEFSGKTLKLGDLDGNQFGIVIRQVNKESLEAVEKAFTSLRDHGFINYYGLQRFGTFSVPSHVIGKYILCEDFGKAVDALLNPAKHTLQESMEAREVWANEHDAAKALKLMPRRCLAESSLLTALVESDNALNALLRVPHNLKTMYVHAYQSFVWNAMASERIKLNRYEPINGDLVLGDNDNGVKRARPITQEEIDSKSKTIFDVVLPTPGFDVEYPANIVDKYEELMSSDNIDCHNMKRKVKEFSLFGSYRHLLAKPLFCEWSVRTYANDEDTVLYTDKEALEYNTKYAPEPTEGEIKTAVILKLGLSSSQYATMALREAMKQETSRNGAIYYG